MAYPDGYSAPMAMMEDNSCGIPECQKARYVKNGIAHGYCGRTHAAEAVSRGLLYGLQTPHGICHRCNLNGCAEVVYMDEDTGRVHDFCSRRHANMAMARGEWPLDNTQGSSQCVLHGCQDFVYRDPNTGEESEYCSRTHYYQGKQNVAQGCINPQCFRPAWCDTETGETLYYCGSRCAAVVGQPYLCSQEACSLPGCAQARMLHYSTYQDLGYCCADHQDRAGRRQLGPNMEPFVDRTFRGGTDDFQLSVLTNAHEAYASIKQQFFSKWEKPSSGLVVERIFKVQVPVSVKEAHTDYAATVSNVRRRFHGTSCSDPCRFYVDLRGGPCGRQDCSVCSICTHGFKISGFNGRTAQQTNVRLRYGEGLYFSSVSGKANDYAESSQKDGPHGRKWRCMFMVSVAVGHAYQTQEAFLDANMCPPHGYDSVVGEVGTGLNHDEVVVYDEHAALPTYLIAYSQYL